MTGKPRPDILGPMIHNRSHTQPRQYVIRIAGHLDEAKWSHWFGDLDIEQQADGTTILSGRMPDQPALYGVLTRISNLGIDLISVNPTGESKIAALNESGDGNTLA